MRDFPDADGTIQKSARNQVPKREQLSVISSCHDPLYSFPATNAIPAILYRSHFATARGTKASRNDISLDSAYQTQFVAILKCPDAEKRDGNAMIQMRQYPNSEYLLDGFLDLISGKHLHLIKNC